MTKVGWQASCKAAGALHEGTLADRRGALQMTQGLAGAATYKGATHRQQQC